jgi:hypothetical protein
VPDQSNSPKRGTARLLWDCENVGSLLARGSRPSARVRLEAELGPELTEALLVSLASLRQDAVADGESDAA